MFYLSFCVSVCRVCVCVCRCPQSKEEGVRSPVIGVVVGSLTWELEQGLTAEPWLAENSLCGPGWPLTHSNPPASASTVLGVKTCTTI